jgi:hypothetical protein
LDDHCAAEIGERSAVKALRFASAVEENVRQGNDNVVDETPTLLRIHCIRLDDHCDHRLRLPRIQAMVRIHLLVGERSAVKALRFASAVEENVRQGNDNVVDETWSCC